MVFKGYNMISSSIIAKLLQNGFHLPTFLSRKLTILREDKKEQDFG